MNDIGYMIYHLSYIIYHIRYMIYNTLQMIFIYYTKHIIINDMNGITDQASTLQLLYFLLYKMNVCLKQMLLNESGNKDFIWLM